MHVGSSFAAHPTCSLWNKSVWYHSGWLVQFKLRIVPWRSLMQVYLCFCCCCCCDFSVLVHTWPWVFCGSSWWIFMLAKTHITISFFFLVQLRFASHLMKCFWRGCSLLSALVYSWALMLKLAYLYLFWAWRAFIRLPLYLSKVILSHLFVCDNFSVSCCIDSFLVSMRFGEQCEKSAYDVPSWQARSARIVWSTLNGGLTRMVTFGGLTWYLPYISLI